jgi:hypothetical protein
MIFITQPDGLEELLIIYKTKEIVVGGKHICLSFFYFMEVKKIIGKNSWCMYSINFYKSFFYLSINLINS